MKRKGSISEPEFEELVQNLSTLWRNKNVLLFANTLFLINRRHTPKVVERVLLETKKRIESKEPNKGDFKDE